MFKYVLRIFTLLTALFSFYALAGGHPTSTQVPTYFVCYSPDPYEHAFTQDEPEDRLAIMKVYVALGQCAYLGGPKLVEVDEPVKSWYKKPYLFSVWSATVEGTKFYVLHGEAVDPS